MTGDRAAELAKEAMASLQTEGLRDYLTARCEEALRTLQREAAAVARDWTTHAAGSSVGRRLAIQIGEVIAERIEAL